MTAGEETNVEKSWTSFNVHADTRFSNSCSGDSVEQVGVSILRLQTSSVMSETETVVFVPARDDDLVEERITPSNTCLRDVAELLTRGFSAFVLTATDLGFVTSRNTTSDPSSDTDIALDPFFDSRCGVVGGRLMISLESLLVNGARFIVGLVMGL